MRCEHCHVPDGDMRKGKRTAGSGRREGYFLDKQGRRHKLPLMKRSVAEHAIEGMKRVHCLGCHAAWGFNDYGMSLIRDDRMDLSRWAPWYLQGDENIFNLFGHNGNLTESISGAGPWFLAWGFRRWEYLTLGVDGKDRIVPYRPRYQYTVSYVDGDGEVVLDSVIPQRGDKSGPGWAYMPFYPHTVRKRGRACENCHGSDLAAGKGTWKGKGKDLSLTKPTPPVYTGLRLLERKEVKSLIEKTPLFRRYRFRTLSGQP